MIFKKFIKVITPIMFLSVLFLFFSSSDVEAVTGAIYGRVWVYDDFGNPVYLPGVRIYREDNFNYETTGELVSLNERLNDPDLAHLSDEAIRDIYRSYKGGVETTSTVDGYWYFGPNHPPYEEGNGLYYERPKAITWIGFGPDYPPTNFSLIPYNNDPVPVSNASEPGGYCGAAGNQSLCPTGTFMNVSDKGGDCEQLNYCGLNCLETPHAYRAYFPPGYTYIDEYFGGSIEFDPTDPKGGGRFRAIAGKYPFNYESYFVIQKETWSQGVNPWDGYQPLEYYIVNSYNNRYTGPYDFIWIPPEDTSNQPPNIVETEPKEHDDITSWIGTATNDDNGWICHDFNPYTYTAHLSDPNGSRDIDIIEFNLMEWPEEPPYIPWNEKVTPKRWPLRILFAQEWRGQSGRTFADYTFFVRDREIKSWDSNKCFTKNRVLIDSAPTGFTYPLTGSNIEPRKTTQYTLNCYGYDDHTWIDKKWASGKIEGIPVDIAYIDRDISVYNSGYDAKLKGSSNWEDASYVAFAKNGNDVFVQFKVEFLGDETNTEWKTSSEFRNLWRVVDLSRAQDKTHNESNDHIFTHYIAGNYSQYYHHHGFTKFDMIPPTVTLGEAVPAEDGENYKLSWNANDGESGLLSVTGEMLVDSPNPSTVRNYTAVNRGDPYVPYNSPWGDRNYRPWLEDGTAGGSCSADSDCPDGACHPDGYCVDCTNDNHCDKYSLKHRCDLETYTCWRPSAGGQSCGNTSDCDIGHACICPDYSRDNCYANTIGSANETGRCEFICNTDAPDPGCPVGEVCTPVPDPKNPPSVNTLCVAPTGINECASNEDCAPYACVDFTCTTRCFSDRDCAGWVNDGSEYYVCDCPGGVPDGACLPSDPGQCRRLFGQGEGENNELISQAETSQSVLGVGPLGRGDFTWKTKDIEAEMKDLFLWVEMGPGKQGLNEPSASRTELLDVGENLTTNERTVNINIYAQATDVACNRSINPSSQNFISFDPWFSSRGGLLFSERISADIAVTDFEGSTAKFNDKFPFSTTPYNYPKGEVSLSSEWLAVGPTGTVSAKHKINQTYSEFYPARNYNDENNQSHYQTFLEKAMDKSQKAPSAVKYVTWDQSSINHDQRNGVCNQTAADLARGQVCVIHAKADSLTIKSSSRFFDCNSEKVYFFVDGDLIIEKEIAAPTAGSNGCLFSVKKDVTIKELQKNSYSTNYPQYDRLETLIMADGRIAVNSSSQNYGLAVRGGLISTGGSSDNPSITMGRSLKMLHSKDYPSYLIHWDPRFPIIASNIFAKEDFEYETEVGVKE